MNCTVTKMVIIVMSLGLFMLPMDRVDAATRLLEKDSQLVVAGSGGIPKLVVFRGGTEVQTNDLGEVTEGVLAKATGFYPPGYQLALGINFKEGTRIVLNSKGDIIRGTLAEVYDVTPQYSTNVGPGGFASTSTYSSREKVGFLLYLGPAYGRNSYGIPAKAHAEISFHDNGIIAACTLFNGPITEDILLRPVSFQRIVNNNLAGFVKFQKDTAATFNANGEVTKGTIGEDLRYKSPNGNEILLKAGTTVDFSTL
jgi:hypothetical protein